MSARAGGPLPLRPGTGTHPRPQLTRERWWTLDGPWEFARDRAGTWRQPADVAWEGVIQVPFAPETERSGVRDTSFFNASWYRQSFETPALQPGQRLFLRFGAVDYLATVWVNGVPVARHEGGYTPFSVDVTPALAAGPMAVVVRAEDDPHDLAKPRGKQDWQVEPHSIWYPRTSGIWRTVWMEVVPATRLRTLVWTPALADWAIGLHSTLEGAPRSDLRLHVRLSVGENTLADDTYSVMGGEVNRRIVPSDPGVDDYRNELLWSPSNPTLIEAHLELWGQRGEKIDEARSYTALRSVGVQGDRFLLNGRVHQLRMVLDQGYWPETGATPPDDEALRRDVELTKAMGFNGVRKHQKIEDPRYLYWADRLGLMVWEEMPSAYRFTGGSVERLTKQWIEVMSRDRSHPCIVAWVPFNESWGVPDLPAIEAQRHYVQALYHLTKTFDPSRPVVGNDGWESVATDIVGIHDYDDDAERLARRYARPDVLPQLFRHGRPGGRLLTLEGHPHAGQPIMLTEFGGITVGEACEDKWGYSRCGTPEEFAEKFRRLLEVVRTSELLAGFCYTQFADTYQESNGLLYADRRPKLPLEQIALATRGRPVIDPSRAAEAFHQAYGREPRLFRAPGRVNLIGEHTDYNDGFVLPIALDRETVVAARPRPDRRIRARSVDQGPVAAAAPAGEIDLDAPPTRHGNWLDYVEGTARVLEDRFGRLAAGADLLVMGDVPVGAGLSSSASLEMSVGLALATLAGWTVDRPALALAGQAAEHRFVGTRCGIMDQLVSMLGRAGHAVLIDCRTLDTRPIPLHPDRASVLVFDSGVRHQHSSGEYNVRRAQCEEAVSLLSALVAGVRALRDVTPEALAEVAPLLPDPILRRARHVVTEIDRTVRAAAALSSGDLAGVGQLMFASHRSLRDDFEVSVAELDTLVQAAASAPGVFGARMTGGGFGGCAVALVEQGREEAAGAAVAKVFAMRFGRAPGWFVTQAADGACEVGAGRAETAAAARS